MKIIETGPREIGFVLWGHCQNLLDDPRMCQEGTDFFKSKLTTVSIIYFTFCNKVVKEVACRFFYSKKF